MKSLQTIQKICKIFQTLTKIAMILCFAGSVLLLLGLICSIVISGNMETLYTLTSSNSFLEMVGTLLAEFVLTLTDALLFFHAWKYFSAELADGTPFSHRGADFMNRLGILLIVLPAVAATIVSVLHGIFPLTRIEAADVGNGTSVMMGIMLIFVSLILRYGAELENERKLLK